MATGKVRVDLENGHRHPLWIPERHSWLIAMIDNDIKKQEDMHRRASRNSIILEILLGHYEPLLGVEDKIKEEKEHGKV